jgi:hypothetical protein
MNLKAILKKGTLLVTALLFLAGCAKDEVGGVSISSGETTEIYAVTNISQEVKFFAGDEWTASCSADWLTFSPKKGGEGSNVITVSTTSTNRTQSVRTAKLVISSGGKRSTVTIKQGNEYAVFDAEVFSFAPEGGELKITFKTNMGENDLSLYISSGMDEWIPELKKDQARTRASLREGKIKTLTVTPNTGVNPRTGAFFLAMKDKLGNPLMLDTLFIYQGGMSDGYYSIDYSADGLVEQLNKSTQGKGIPIVIMGDGFQDRHIADSTYSRVMNQTMDNLFSEEPFKSLKDYFDIYAVTTVSKHNNFGEGYETALSTVPDHQTMGIKMDTKAVMSYVKRVEDVDSLNTLAVVILNTNIHRGVTYMFYNKDNTPPINYAIALCPVIDSLKSESFRSVLVHEAIGHGFAKLADEYVRSTEGSATEREIKWLKEYHAEDRLLNVDSESDPSKTIWSRFVSDPEFANENLGAYEGGWTYYTGIYRPSQESMMRSNNAPFNAPSRWAIYDRVMLLATGKKTYYEDFVAFDKDHKPTEWSYESRYGARTRQSWEAPWHPAPPRIILRTW